MPSANGNVVEDVIDARRVEALARAYDVAIKIVKDYLDGKDIPEERVEVARITVAQWSKVRQTDNARAALNFMMQRQMVASRPVMALSGNDDDS